MQHLSFRYQYFLLFIFIFIIEVLIAKYLQDPFIRPFVGDVLVVILIYSFFSIFLNCSTSKLAFAVFIFACSIEILQWFHLVKLFHLENNKFMKIALGSVFDIKDILAYFAGYLICLRIK
ncbi:MAG: DUF2809 domain-containing protein [Chitinophagales bacterium]|nr:DUF2809 domain-containing protein [Chitinophagales bacterium]